MVLRPYKRLAGRILVTPFAVISALVLSALVKSMIILSIFASSPLIYMVTIGGGTSPTHQDTKIGEVSGLYGPGAYIAWVLCTISAIIGSATKHDSPLLLSSDQIASFLYSTCSLYWSYCHGLRYQPEGRKFIQDPSVQAASFVFNVSALLHGIGLLFSTEEKRAPWVYLVIWDGWLCFFSPIAFLSGGLFLTHILGLYTQIISLGPVFTPIKPPSWLTSTFLLGPFSLLEIGRRHLSDSPIDYIPRTTSSLTDLDQFVALVTAIVALVYQWRIWDFPPIRDRLQGAFRQTPTRGNSIQLEESLPLAHNRSTIPNKTNNR
jgi:hypothetical protein